jgi:hypothetical protein
MTGRLQASALTPWAGLFLGAAAWFAHQQIGSAANIWNCRAAGGAFIVGVGLVCGLVALGGGLVSWMAHVPQDDEARQNRNFARIVGMTGAGVFLLAIAFQTLAGVLVPACHR